MWYDILIFKRLYTIFSGIYTIEENDNENSEMKLLSSGPSDPNDYMLNNKSQDSKMKQQKKEYTPIKSYKPSGNLIYDDDLLNKIEGKFFK
jgi:hypothetical protein